MTIKHERIVVLEETRIKPKHLIRNRIIPFLVGFPRIKEIVLIPDRVNSHNDTVEIVESDGYSIELKGEDINNAAFCRKNGIFWREGGEGR